MKHQILHLWFLFVFLTGCASPYHPGRNPGSDTEAIDDVVSANAALPNYPEIFKSSRELLIPVDKNKLRKVPEHVVVDELYKNPSLLAKAKADLVKELEAGSQQLMPAGHTRLMPPAGMSGYSNLKLFVDHPYYKDGELVPASNLIKVWKSFILSARKEIILNVFDFDLMEIADALIEQAKKGVDVRVGIDKKNVIDVRPEVAEVKKKLQDNGVHVTGVIPVSLNHQKVTAIDWSDPSAAKVLFSSGNLTRSCLDPEGDLKGTKPLPKESVPNANHMITMNSWLLANLVYHELTKTLDSRYLLRGSKYPLNGAYQVTGPGVDPNTLEAYPEPSVVISFTPGGGLKNVNKNIISQFIKQEKGRIRMLQFAYSSPDVDEALLFRAQQDLQNDGKFDFMSVGDTPFAMREWSRFLIMSGYKRVIDGKKSTYVLDPENPWVKALGEKQVSQIAKRVYVAPREYGNNWALVEGKKVKVNAKIHHKILATENFAIMGTSFNFSEGAESNNEQILVFRDRSLADAVDGMVRYLVEHSPGSVVKEAERRNKFGGGDDDDASSPEDVPGGKTPK